MKLLSVALICINLITRQRALLWNIRICPVPFSVQIPEILINYSPSSSSVITRSGTLDYLEIYAIKAARNDLITSDTHPLKNSI